MEYGISRKIYKWVCYFALMFVSVILETTIFAKFSVFGSRPQLVPFIVASISLLEGGEEGAIAGVCGGFLCDALYSGYEGFYTIVLPILAVGICFMNTVMYWKNYGMAVLDWIVLVIALQLVHFCIYMLVAGNGTFLSVLRVVPGEIVATIPFTPVLYIIIAKMSKVFFKPRED